MRRLFFRKGGKIMALMTAIIMLSFTSGDDQDEHTVKALFIYNFTKHVEWPKGKISGRFVIGVMGNTPVLDRLNLILKDRKIKDRPVDIKRISSGDQVETCDILFITHAESYHLKEISEKYDYYGVLIITEDKNMSQKGACINIIEKDEKLKFQLNEAAIRKEGLKISNQLYELASVKE